MRSILEIVATMYHGFNKQVIDNDWVHHKKEIQLLLDEAFKLIVGKKKDALILGAGNCNDLNLSEIVRHFEFKVHLLDIDKKSLRAAIAKEEPNVKKKLKELIIDLTGLYANKQLAELVKALENENYDSVIKIVQKWMSPFFPLCSPNIINKKYPFILSSTISTQLASPIAGLIERKSVHLNGELVEFYSYLTQKHIRQIAELLEDNGTAVLVSEQYEWGTNNDSGDLPTMSYIEKPEYMLQQDYQNKVEQRYHFLRGRITKHEISKAGLNIIKESQWIWNILGNRHYLVKGWVVQK